MLDEVKDFVDNWLRDNHKPPMNYRVMQVSRGEADQAIRRMSLEKIALKEEVIILSDDASLILGIPFTAAIASPTRLSLRKLPHAASNLVDSGRIQLFGPIFSIQQFVTALHRAALERIKVDDKNLKTFAKECLITEDMLVHIAALLGGDHDNCDFDIESNPFIMNKFLSKLFLKHGTNDDTKDDRLIAAAALVIMWKANESYFGASINLAKVMTVVIDIAKQMSDPAKNVFSSFNRPIFGISRTVFQGSYHDANNVGKMSGGMLESCLKSRLLESSNDSLEHHTQYHYGRWGLWCSTLEPKGESTELILSPIISLVRQAHYMRGGDVPLVLNDDNLNLRLDSAQEFNLLITTIFIAANAVSNVSSTVANTAGNDDSDDEWNSELAPSTKGASTNLMNIHVTIFKRFCG